MATAVFAFVVTSILGVYVSAIQLDRKSRSQRAVAQNARFIMDFLAKEVRNGTINYASYSGGIVAGTNDLYLENQANAIEHFSLNGTNLVLNKSGTNTNMNSSGTKVTNLKFYIQPVGDPYTTLKTYNEQPRVTVVMELTSNYSTRPNDLIIMDLESTFATRNYPARQ